jgi:hypothetical protein
MSHNETFLQAKVAALAKDFTQCYDALLDATGRAAVLTAQLAERDAKIAELEAKLPPPAA